MSFQYTLAKLKLNQVYVYYKHKIKFVFIFLKHFFIIIIDKTIDNNASDTLFVFDFIE
jgi:hypothetical protein